MSSRRDRIRAKILARIWIDPVTGAMSGLALTPARTVEARVTPAMSLDGQTVAVHIAMWTNEHGYISGKKELDHVCRNRLCVRPEKDHVELVTRKENAKRREKAKRGMIGHNGRPALECAEVF